MIAWLVLRTGFSAFIIKAVLIGVLVAGLWASFAIWKHSIYMQGWNAADAMWKEKALEAKIEKLEREIAAQKAADAEEEKVIAELEAEKAKLEKENEEYEKELALRGDKCPLTDDDIKRLRRKKSDYRWGRGEPARLAFTLRPGAYACAQSRG